MSVNLLISMNAQGGGRLAQGWGQRHVYLPDVGDLKSIVPQVKKLCDLRTALNGENVWTVQARLSQVLNRRISKRLIAKFEPNQQSPINGIGGCKGFMSDQPNSCVNVEMKSAGGQRSMINLAGIPDVLVGMNPAGVLTGNVPGWQAKFDAFIEELTNDNWGFWARVIYQAPTDILFWTNEAAGGLRMIYTVDTAHKFGNVGDQVMIRDSLMNVRGLPSPNGMWVIDGIADSPTQTSYTLRNSEGISAADIRRPGTVEPVSYQLVPYSTGEIIGQMTRKRGVGSIRARGRSSRRRRQSV